MNRTIQRRTRAGLLAAAVGVFLLHAGSAAAVDPEPGRVAAIRADTATQIRTLMDRQGVASVVVVAFNGERILWADAFGDANVGRAVPATLDTVYNTGSSFKIVMTTAIMQLIEAGRLALDTPVNEYLTMPIAHPPNVDRPLTLRHMLAHHSGLPSSRPVPAWDLWSRKAPPPIREQIAKLELVATPGTVYDYCNTCFMLYADIIERASGMPLERYLRERILIPAGSRYTEPLFPDAAMVEHMALPYEQVGRTPVAMPQKFLASWMSGDTYLRPLDMAALLQPFLNDGRAGDARLLSAATVRSMIPPQFGDFSLGFVSVMDRDRRLLWWDGGVYGGSTVYHLEPEIGFGIFLASNANVMTDALHALARRVRDLIHGLDSPFEPLIEEAPDVRIAAFDRSALVGYVGSYRIEGAGAEVRVDPLNDGLALINPAGERFQLVMTSIDRGVLIGPREDVYFERDADGAIHALRIGSPDGARAVRVDG